MAKYQIKFYDIVDNTTIQTICLKDVIQIHMETNDEYNICIHLDKSTAIKFAKTLRTEINKMSDNDEFEKLSNTF